MNYGPFDEEYPEVARQETRQIIILNEGGALPQGRYLLVELFCTDPDCDCRRVFLSVYHVEREQMMAVIAYGWEDRQYYREWFGRDIPDMSDVWEEDTPDMVDELKGPVLNTASPQSEYAPAILDEVESVLQDEEYVERIKKHYQMFNDSLASQG